LTPEHVFVADTFNHRVQVFDRDLGFVGTFGLPGYGYGEMSYPVGVAGWRYGFLFVSDERNKRLQLWRIISSRNPFEVECLDVNLCGAWLGSPFGLFLKPHSDLMLVADRRFPKIAVLDLRKALNPYL
jgi:hypothetical protein